VGGPLSGGYSIRTTIQAWAPRLKEGRPNSALAYNTPNAFAERLFSATVRRFAPIENFAHLSVAPAASVCVSI